MAKIKHLQKIHDLKSYRNACRAIAQLKQYTNTTYHNREKVVYLNKEGRRLIGSEKEVKNSPLIAHTLLRNEVYLYFNCPQNWQTEYALETEQKALSSFQIQVQGLTLKTGKKVVSDAIFNRNGYLHIIEVDHTRDMADNRKKIQSYREVLKELKEPYILYFFTVSEHRKRKLIEWCKGLKCEVKTFTEIG